MFRCLLVFVLVPVIAFAQADEDDVPSAEPVGKPPAVETTPPAEAPPATPAPPQPEPAAEPVKPKKETSTGDEEKLRKTYLSTQDKHFGKAASPDVLKLKDARRRREPGAWRRSVETGLTVNRGNTDSELYILKLEASRKGEGREFLFSAQGNYGEDDGETSKESAQGKLRHSRDLSGAVYHALEARANYDALADLDYQFIATWSIGYRIANTEDAYLAVEAGPGYVEEKKGGEKDGYLAAHFAQKGELLVNESVIIWEAIDIFPSLEDTSRFLITAEAGIETKINSSLRFRAALQDRYDSEPAEGKKENDLQTVLSLVLDF